MSFVSLFGKGDKSKIVFNSLSKEGKNKEKCSIKQQRTERVALHVMHNISNRTRSTSVKRSFKGSSSGESSAKKLKLEFNKDTLLKCLKEAFVLCRDYLKSCENQSSYNISKKIQSLLNITQESELSECINVDFSDCDVVSSDMLDVLLFLFKLPRDTRSERMSFHYCSTLKIIMECVVQLGFDKIFHSIIENGIVLDEIQVDSLSMLLLAYDNKQYTIAAAVLENNKHRAEEFLDELVFNNHLLICILPCLNTSFINLILSSLVRKSFINLERNAKGYYDIDSRCAKIERLSDTSNPTPLEQALSVEDESLFFLLLALGASDLSSFKSYSVVHYSLLLNDSKAILRAIQNISVKDLFVDRSDLVQLLINQGCWVSLFTLHIFGYKLEEDVKDRYLSLVDKDLCLDMLVELSIHSTIMTNDFKQNVIKVIKRKEFRNVDFQDRVVVLLQNFEDNPSESVGEFDVFDLDLLELDKVFNIINNSELELLNTTSKNKEIQKQWLLDLINKDLKFFEKESENKQPLVFFSFKEILHKINICIESGDLDSFLEIYTSLLQDQNPITDKINMLFEKALEYLILQTDKDLIAQLEYLVKVAFCSCKLQEVNWLAIIYKTKTNQNLRIHLREFLKTINNSQISYGVKVTFINEILNSEKVEYYVEDPLYCIEQLNEDGCLINITQSFITKLVKDKKVNFLNIFLQKCSCINNFDKVIRISFMLSVNKNDYQQAALLLEHAQDSCDLLSLLEGITNKNFILASILEYNSSDNCINKIVSDLVKTGCIDLEKNKDGLFKINSRCFQTNELNPSAFTVLEQAILMDDSELFTLLIALKSSYNSSIINCNVLHFALLFCNQQLILSVLKKLPQLVTDLNRKDIVFELFFSKSWLSILVLHLFGYKVEESVLELARASIDNNELLDFILRLSTNQKLMKDDLKNNVLKLLENERFKKDFSERDLELVVSLYSDLKCSKSTEVIFQDEERWNSFEFGLLSSLGFQDEILFSSSGELNMLYSINKNISKIIKIIIEQEDDSQADILKTLLSLQDIFNVISDYSEAIQLVEACLLGNATLSLDVIDLMYDILDVTIPNNSKSKLSRLHLLVSQLIESGKIVETKKMSKLLFNKTKRGIKVRKSNFMNLLKNKEVFLQDKMLFLEALIHFANIDTTIVIDQKELLEFISDTNQHPRLLEECVFVFLLSQQELWLAFIFSKNLSTEQLEANFSLYIKLFKPDQDLKNKCFSVFIDSSLKSLILQLTSLEKAEDFEEPTLDITVNQMSDGDVLESDTNIVGNVEKMEPQANKEPVEMIEKTATKAGNIIKQSKSFFSLVEDALINNKEALLKQLLDFEEFKNFPITCFKMMKIALNTDDLDVIFLYLHYFSPFIKEFSADEVNSFVNLCVRKQKSHAIFMMQLLGLNIHRLYFDVSKRRIGIEVILDIFIRLSKESHIFTKKVKCFVFSCLLIENLLTENIADITSKVSYLMSLFSTNETYVIDDSYGKRIKQVAEELDMIEQDVSDKESFTKCILTSNYSKFFNMFYILDVKQQEEIFDFCADVVDNKTLISFFNTAYMLTEQTVFNKLVLRTLISFGFVKNINNLKTTGVCLFEDRFVSKKGYDVICNGEESDLFDLFLKIQNIEQRESFFVGLVKKREFAKALRLMKYFDLKKQYTFLRHLRNIEDFCVIDFFIFSFEAGIYTLSKACIINFMTFKGWIKHKALCVTINQDDICCEENIFLVVSTLIFKLKQQSLIKILSCLNIKQLTIREPTGNLRTEEKALQPEVLMLENRNKIVKEDFIRAVISFDIKSALNILDSVDFKQQESVFYSLKLLDNDLVVNFLYNIFKETQQSFSKYLILNVLRDLGFVELCDEIQAGNVKKAFYVGEYFITQSGFEFIKNKESLLEFFFQLQNKIQRLDSFVLFVKKRKFKEAVIILKLLSFKESEKALRRLMRVTK